MCVGGSNKHIIPCNIKTCNILSTIGPFSSTVPNWNTSTGKVKRADQLSIEI